MRLLKNSEWFYVEGYLVTDEARTKAIKEAVEYAKEQGVKIAISLSDPFVVDVFGDALRDVMGSGVDLVFCNKDEALSFTGSDDLDSAIEKLKLLQRALPLPTVPTVPLPLTVIRYQGQREYLPRPLTRMVLGTCLQVPSCTPSPLARTMTGQQGLRITAPHELLPSLVQG